MFDLKKTLSLVVLLTAMNAAQATMALPQASFSAPFTPEFWQDESAEVEVPANPISTNKPAAEPKEAVRLSYSWHQRYYQMVC